jgi:hypothetical protein
MDKIAKDDIRPTEIHPSAHMKAAINSKIHKPTWKEIQTRPHMAKLATMAAKAMHGSAPNTPYEIMGEGSSTAAANAIQNKLTPIKRKKSTQEEKAFLAQTSPLNPNTRRGCPCCRKHAEHIVADCQHYTMGHCKRMQKHMTIDFGNRVAAWIICQSCPNTIVEPEPDYTPLKTANQSIKHKQKDHTINPMVPEHI